MRRVLWFLRWKISWWKEQGSLRQDVLPDIREGLVAYAEKQAAILDRMRIKFSDEWYGVLATNGLSTEWPEEDLARWAGYQVEPISMEDLVEDGVDIEDDLFE